MLLIDRKKDEEITLVLANGQILTLKVIALTNKSTRIGINAPQTVKIFRKEIYLEKLSEGTI